METHMTRTEYRQLLAEMASHADAMDQIAKKLLDKQVVASSPPLGGG